MAKNAEYKIIINGLQESITQVDALNKGLDALEKKIGELEKKNVNINATTTTTSTQKVDNAPLQEQDKLTKDIWATQQKINDARDKDYQELVRLKDELKQAKVEAEGLAAASKLDENNYNLNTMEGIKEKLKDIKREINTTDIGSDQFKKLTEEANELNTKLKDIEQSYGQFGRNVGNYASAAEGFDKLRIQVGDTTREFDNAREALKSLKNERDTLALMGKDFKDIDLVVKQLQSSIKDMSMSSAGMDNLLDTMQSIIAISSTAKGIGAVFGMDNDKIEETIKKLVALQNVMQGIETIQKQIQTQEGIGKWLSAGNSAIDKYVASLTKAKIETEGLTLSSRGATIAVRTLSTVLKALGVGIVIAGVTALVSLLQDASKWMAEGVDQATAFRTAIEKLNKDFERRNELLNAQYISGEISGEQYLNNVLETQNKYLQDNIKLINERNSIGGWSKKLGETLGGKQPNLESPIPNGGIRVTDTWSSTYVKTIEDARKKLAELNSEAKKGFNIFESLFGIEKNNTANRVTLGNAVLADYVNMLKGVGNQYAEVTAKQNALTEAQKRGEKVSEDEKKALELQFNGVKRDIQGLIDKLNDDEILSSIIMNLDKYIPDEASREAFQNIINAAKDLSDTLSTNSPKFLSAKAQWDIDAMKDGYSKSIAELNKAQREEEAQWTGNQEALNAIAKKYAQKRVEIWKSENKARLDSDDELQRLRIEKMREGLAKTLAELRLEEKQRIRQAEESERNVQDKILAIQELYRQKRLDAYKEHNEKMLEAVKEFNTELRSWASERTELLFDAKATDIENILNAEISSFEENFVKVQKMLSEMNSAVYNNTISKSTAEKLGGLERIDPETYNEAYKEVLKVNEEYYQRVFSLQKLSFEQTKENEQKRIAFELKIRNTELDEEYENFKKRLDKQKEFEINSLEQDENYETLKAIIENNYRIQTEDALKLHNQRKAAIEEDYAKQEISIIQEANKNIQDANASRFSSEIADYEAYYSQLSRLNANQPTLDRSGWGIVNIGATRDNYKVVLDGFKELSNKIKQEKDKLVKALLEKEISFDDFNQANKELDNLKNNVTKTADDINKNAKNLLGDFIASISTYVNALGQGLQSIMSQLYANQDAAYEKQKEDLEKETEDLEEQLNKQKEITEKYKNDVDNIEKELSTARGDRRQELIDQLNAEKAAQRAALAEKKRIEREEERLKEKADKLDKEQREREHKRQITDAVISAALAVVNGLATKPFVPVGIAMGALAGALGAAQVALIKSQKYATGGLLNGKSHAQGGIPVGNTGIEVEGNEYIIRKKSTQRNIDLLDYINKSEKKLTLDDFIDFYSGKVRKTILATSPMKKFASGGELSLLNNDITINNKLLNAFERYAERPSVVSVTEINQVQDDLRQVQVLAGATE